MQITARKREKTGKKVKALRNERQMPAVMFGKGLDSQNLAVDLIEFSRVFKEVGETALVDLALEDSTEKVLIKDVQMHPVTSTPIHAGFHKVDLTETITAEIPVKVVGEENSEILKSGEGMLLTILNTIEVECLPTDLPAEFEVDVSNLKEIGDGITISELNFDREKVELSGGLEDDELILKIDYAEMEEEEEEEIDEAEALEGIEATEETAEDEEGETEGGNAEKPSSDEKEE